MSGDGVEKEVCRLGYEEHDGSAYCFAHSRFVAYAAGERRCPAPRVCPSHWPCCPCPHDHHESHAPTDPRTEATPGGGSS
jgi:hypothetical protein